MKEEELMKWAVEACDNWGDDPERIQQAGEPLMAVVRAAKVRIGGVLECAICLALLEDGDWSAGEHRGQCPVPAALKAMEEA